MKFTKLASTVSLLIVGLGLAITPKANASLQFNGSNSKAVLDGSYLDATTHSNYTFEVWIKPYSLGGTLLGKTESWKDWTLDTISDGGIRLRGLGRITTGETHRKQERVPLQQTCGNTSVVL